MLACFEVVVLLSLVALLFSWTMIVRMSPTPAARLSETIEREASSFQSDCAWRGPAERSSKIEKATKGSKYNQHRLLILNLSFEFAPGLQVAHTHNLARNSVLQSFRFHGDRQRLILKH